MTWLGFEIRLLLRSRLCAACLLLLFGLSTMAVWFGLQEVTRQQETIAHVAPLHEQDVAAIAEKYASSPTAGSAAYYTFYSTWDQPSDAAFLALGFRDVTPYILRIRALGLQAQLYEGEHFNPELALPGRFDFAFVLIYLAPLFIIALLYDMMSSERQSGRLRLLLSLPEGRQIWYRRAILRYALVLICLAIPVVVGVLFAGSSLLTAALVLLVIASYLAFWTGLSLLVAKPRWESTANATALMGVWVLLTLLLPTLANVALVRAIPVNQGVDLMLAQREAVHGAWEVPREETMQRFFSGHPEWQATSPLPSAFHWKWYFAFHQVGDESVAEQAQAYRAGLNARQEWTNTLGWIMPTVGAQAILHRIADTDLHAQLAYQDQIAAFHQEIREFYYSYLFNEKPFGKADFAKQPVFTPRASDNTVFGSLLGIFILPWLVFLFGLWRIKTRRISV